MKLYVDDVRQPPQGWQVARTVKEAVDILGAQAVEEVSLDFVIGNEGGDNFSPVARFIVSMPKEKRPRIVRIHTSSSVGARILESILEGNVEKIM
jgi:hypothetical protein